MTAGSSGHFELLGEFQPLSLIVRAYIGPVNFLGTGRQAFEAQSPYHLFVFQQEGDVVGSHLQHTARAGRYIF